MSSLFLTHNLDSIYNLAKSCRRKDPNLSTFFPGSICTSCACESVKLSASSNCLISHFEATPLHALTNMGLDPGLLGEQLQQRSSTDFLFASGISVF